MRVVFLGTPDFAVSSLKTLAASHYEIGAVFSQPDRPSGRGQKLHPTPIRVCAQNLGLPIFQPMNVGDDDSRALIAKIQPDFIVVVAYGQILPGALLKLARIAPVNVHGSLLPRYRGAAPVAWAILNGEEATGVTTMIIEERLDSGPMLLRREIPISRTVTAGELASQLSEIGAALLLPTLDGLSNGSLAPVPQDDAQATLAPRLKKEMSWIAWARPAERIHNQIRALNPWPLAQCDFGGTPLKILRSLSCPSEGVHGSMPGTLLAVTEVGMVLQCGEDSALEIIEVQLPGRSRISGKAFANGARLHPGLRIFSTMPDREA